MHISRNSNEAFDAKTVGSWNLKRTSSLCKQGQCGNVGRHLSLLTSTQVDVDMDVPNSCCKCINNSPE